MEGESTVFSERVKCLSPEIQSEKYAVRGENVLKMLNLLQFSYYFFKR